MPNYFPLTRAAKHFPGDPHINSLRRWSTKGLNGVKLRTMKFGGKRLTTEEWCNEFREAVAHAEGSSIEHARAEAELDAMGV